MHEKDSLNLKVEIPGDIENIDEFKTLINAFKSLIKESNSLSSNVSAVAQRVNNSSATLDTSVTLSAEQVKLISASIVEISHTIKDVATRTKESNVHAEKARNSTVENKGLLSSKKEEPISERDGKAKRYFSVTPLGMSALIVTNNSWRFYGAKPLLIFQFKQVDEYETYQQKTS